MSGEALAEAKIKISLDATKFRGELEETLKSAPDRLEIEAGLRSREFEGVVAAIRGEIADLEAHGVHLALDLENVEHSKVEIDEIRDRVKLLRADLAALVAEVDTEVAKKKMDELLGRSEELTAKLEERHEFRVAVEQAKEDIRTYQGYIAELQFEMSHLKLGVQTDEVKARLAQIKAEIEILTAGVKVIRFATEGDTAQLAEASAKVDAFWADVEAKDWTIPIKADTSRFDEAMLRLEALQAAHASQLTGLKDLSQGAVEMTPAEQAQAFKSQAIRNAIQTGLREINVAYKLEGDAGGEAKLAELMATLTALEAHDWTIHLKADTSEVDAAIAAMQMQQAMLAGKSQLMNDLAGGVAKMSPSDKADYLQMQATAHAIQNGLRQVEIAFRTEGAEEAMAKVEALNAVLHEIELHDWTAHVQVADSKGGALEQLMTKIDSTTADWGKFTTAITSGAPVIVAALGTIAAAWTILPGTLSGVGVAFDAVLSSGVLKVIQAIDSYRQTQRLSPAQSKANTMQNALTTAEDAQAIIGANQSVANAIRTARDNAIANSQAVQQAEFNSVMSVMQAQDSLRQANEGVTQSMWQQQQAQQALTLARQQATFQLQNYVNQLKDARLAEIGDSLSVRQSELNLRRTLASPQAFGWGLAIEQARLGIAQAVQAVRDQHTASAQLQAQANQAFGWGVNNNPNVVSAQHAVTQAGWQQAAALRAQAEAVMALQQTQITAADGVQNALRAQSQQTALDLQGITNANSQLSLAIQSEQAAQAQQAAGVNSTLQSVQSNLAGLDAAQRSFVEFWHADVSPIIQQFNSADSQVFWGNIRGAMGDLKTVLEIGQPFVLQAAGGISSTIASILHFMATNAGGLEGLMREGNQFFSTFGTTVTEGLKGWVAMGNDAAPLVHAWGDTLLTLERGMSHFFEGQGGKDFVNWVSQTAPAFGTFLRDLFKGIFDIISAIGVLSVPSLKVFDTVLGAFDKFLNNPDFSLAIATIIELTGLVKLMSILKITALVSDLTKLTKLWEGAEGVKASGALGKLIQWFSPNKAGGLTAPSDLMMRASVTMEAASSQFGIWVERMLAASGISVPEAAAGAGAGVAGGATGAEIGAGALGAGALGGGALGFLGADVTAGSLAGPAGIAAAVALGAGYEIGKHLGATQAGTDLGKFLYQTFGGAPTVVAPHLARGRTPEQQLHVDETALSHLLRMRQLTAIPRHLGLSVPAGDWNRNSPKEVAALEHQIKLLNAQIAELHHNTKLAADSSQLLGQHLDYVKHQAQAAATAVQGYNPTANSKISDAVNAIQQLQGTDGTNAAAGIGKTFATFGDTGTGAVDKVHVSVQQLRTAIPQMSGQVTSSQAAITQMADVGSAKLDHLKAVVNDLKQAFPSLGGTIKDVLAHATREGGTLVQQFEDFLHLIRDPHWHYVAPKPAPSLIGRGFPHHAGGGDVQAGRSIYVGEYGPEVFQPTTNGHIYPHGASPSSQSQPIAVHVYVGDRELTDIIDCRVDYLDGQTATALASGAVPGGA